MNTAAKRPRRSCPQYRRGWNAGRSLNGREQPPGHEGRLAAHAARVAGELARLAGSRS